MWPWSRSLQIVQSFRYDRRGNLAVVFAFAWPPPIAVRNRSYATSG
jgi:Flp pilus assembly protein TadG